jgi:citronellol/citronellal dehydrogenase
VASSVVPSEEASCTKPRSVAALAGRTVVVSGGSRGIGLAIGVEAARRGTNAVNLAKRTGQTLIDADVLAETGVSDLSRYGGGDAPVLDLYIDPPDGSEPSILAPRTKETRQ